MSPEREELPLSKAVSLMLDECRMVLPGLQALFGFQLIAVFNSGFGDNWSGRVGWCFSDDARGLSSPNCST